MTLEEYDSLYLVGNYRKNFCLFQDLVTNYETLIKNVYSIYSLFSFSDHIKLGMNSIAILYSADFKKEYGYLLDLMNIDKKLDISDSNMLKEVDKPNYEVKFKGAVTAIIINHMIYNKKYYAAINLLKQFHDKYYKDYVHYSFAEMTYDDYGISENNEFSDASNIIGTCVKIYKNKEDLSKYDYQYYIAFLTKKISEGTLKDLLNNKELCSLHSLIMKKAPKNKAYSFSSNSIIFNPFERNVCRIETTPQIAEMILDETFQNRYYYSRFTLDRDILFGLTTTSVQLFENSFKNYFYSKYGNGSTKKNLDSRIKNLDELISESKIFTDASIYNIVEGLPDKITTTALAALI